MQLFVPGLLSCVYIYHSTTQCWNVNVMTRVEFLCLFDHMFNGTHTYLLTAGEHKSSVSVG